MNTITTIHGRTYETRRDVITRCAELHKLNDELGESDGRVTELNALLAHLDATRKPLAPARPAFSVYYRTATGGKGYKEFKTREGQINFINRTPHAVTFHN